MNADITDIEENEKKKKERKKKVRQRNSTYKTVFSVSTSVRSFICVREVRVSL